MLCNSCAIIFVLSFIVSFIESFIAVVISPLDTEEQIQAGRRRAPPMRSVAFMLRIMNGSKKKCMTKNPFCDGFDTANPPNSHCHSARCVPIYIVYGIAEHMYTLKCATTSVEVDTVLLFEC